MGAWVWIIAAVAVLLALSLAASYIMARNAIDRVQPKLPSWVQRVLKGTGRAVAGRRHSDREARAARLRAMPMEKISVTADDGEALVGRMYALPGAERVVICFHGWRSTWADDFSGPGEMLMNMGCSVVFPDQRAHGESGGRYICFGVKERYDVLKWVERTHELFPDLPLYVFGASMGATTVMDSTGVGLPTYVHGVIEDCGFSSGKDICRHIIRKNMHSSFFFFYPQLNLFCKLLGGFTFGQCSTFDAMRKCRVPVMFIHGEADTFVPASMSRKNYDLCTAPKEIHTFPGAGHIRSWYSDPERYEGIAAEFFTKYD